jgi:hypothetical protein
MEAIRDTRPIALAVPEDVPATQAPPSTSTDRSIMTLARAFFTKGLIGKAIADISIRAGAEIAGCMLGGALFSAAGESIGRSFGQWMTPLTALYGAVTLAKTSDASSQTKALAAFTLAATALVTQYVFSEYISESSAAVVGSLAGLVGEVVGSLAAGYLAAAPDLPFEVYAQRMCQERGSVFLAEMLFPGSGVMHGIRNAVIGVAASNAEPIMNGYQGAMALRTELETHDIGFVIRRLLIEAADAANAVEGGRPFPIPRIVLNQFDYITRVGTRAFNEYNALISNSPTIQAAQQSFIATCRANLGPEAEAAAKQHLLNTIKEETSEKFLLLGVARPITNAVFRNYIQPELEDISIPQMEEYLLGFSITDEASANCTKQLALLHTQSLLAFTTMYTFQNEELSRNEERSLVGALPGLVTGHYARAFPDSRIVELTDTAINFTTNAATSVMLPEEPAQEIAVTPPEETARRSQFEAFLSAVASFFSILWSGFASVFLLIAHRLPTENEFETFIETIIVERQENPLTPAEDDTISISSNDTYYSATSDDNDVFFEIETTED